jgi:hypothetical protein
MHYSQREAEAGSPSRSVTVAPSNNVIVLIHHHHGAGLNIAEGDGGRQRKFGVGIPPPPDVIDAPSGLKGVEFVDDGGGVTVIFGRRHDAVFAVAGMKDGDADHQRGGEVPATGVSDR